MADGDSRIPWYSWLILAFHLLVSGGIFWMMHSNVVPSALAWGITGGWVLLTLIFGLMDFIIAKGDASGTDATAFDRWTIVHFTAGVVFGIWYIPLIWVVILTFLWECFEFSVAGFGDQEVILNRLTDIGSAIVGWFLVVIFVVLLVKAPFPFATPVTSPAATPAPHAAPPHTAPKHTPPHK